MRGDVIMVASGKGGTGKSTLSVLLGAALAARGERVLVAELDVGLRSIDHIAGASGHVVYDVGDVLAGRCDAAKAVVESPLYPDLYLLAAPYTNGRIPSDALCALVQRVRPVFDTVLLDTAAGLGAPFLAARAAANRALLVLTPDPVALRDGRTVCDALALGGCTDARLLINQTPRSLESCGVRSLDECIDTVGARLIGVVPLSDPIRRAGQTGTRLPIQSRDWRVMCAVAARLCGEEVPLIVR